MLAIQEIGIVEQSGMGIAPVKWSEIEAYNRATGSWLAMWDMTTIRQMSEAYCKWHNKGGKQGDIADDVPYINRNEETLASMRNRVVKAKDSR